MSFTNTNHPDLLYAWEHVYSKCGFECTDLTPEAESLDYAAHTFNLQTVAIRYRAAKITPTKTGQFVTLWKRNGNGPILPFEVSDDVKGFIISTRQSNYFGLFLFPKTLLHEKGIVSGNNKDGKRAMRVYPPWDIATSRQAQKTQQWQLKCFLEVTADKPVDIDRAKVLFGNMGAH